MLHVSRRALCCLQCWVLGGELSCPRGAGAESRGWGLAGFHLALQRGSFLMFSVLKMPEAVWKWKLLILMEMKGDSPSQCESRLQNPFLLLFLHIPVEKKSEKLPSWFGTGHFWSRERALAIAAVLPLFQMILTVSHAGLWAFRFLLICPGLPLECCLASELFLKSK